jgi:lipoyl(octanoyl) transferase
MKAWAVTFDSPVAYDHGVHLQESIHALRLAGTIPDVVLFLEHRPVVTLGARGRTQALLATPARLKELGIDFAHASRGGDVTFHGPGQLVMYPILKLGEHEADSHSYLTNLEEIAIRTAADFGVKAYRRKGMNGAWTDQGKLAAIGFRLKRWVTLHGMSFNVCPDLAGFSTIVPCGLKGEPVSSLRAILGAKCPKLAAVREAMMRNFSEICGRPLETFSAAHQLPDLLAFCAETPNVQR